jgi:hypothetical protein
MIGQQGNIHAQGVVKGPSSHLAGHTPVLLLLNFAD